MATTTVDVASVTHRAPRAGSVFPVQQKDGIVVYKPGSLVGKLAVVCAWRDDRRLAPHLEAAKHAPVFVLVQAAGDGTVLAKDTSPALLNALAWDVKKGMPLQDALAQLNGLARSIMTEMAPAIAQAPIA